MFDIVEVIDMNVITENKVASILYEVRVLDSDEVVDSNLNSEPLEFIVGSGQVIKGLERAIIGTKKGDKLNLKIPPEDAYGNYRSDLLQEVPIEQFSNIELKSGMTLFAQGENGNTLQVFVKDFNDKVVMIDYNHPFAGKTLLFNVEVVDSRDATDAEILTMDKNIKVVNGGGCCGGGCGCHH